MLNLMTPIQETRAYQSIFAEGEAKGKEEGKAEGEAKGKAEGKASTLKRQLTRRFCAFPGGRAAHRRGAGRATACLARRHFRCRGCGGPDRTGKRIRLSPTPGLLGGAGYSPGPKVWGL